MFICKYCNDERKDVVSNRNHERMCKHNPNRKLTPKNKDFYSTRKNSNATLKALELGLPPPIVSQETRAKISEKSKSRWTDEKRKEWSDRMKIQSQLNLNNHPDSYSYKNFCGRSKKTLYKDQWMHSSWELEFAKWLDSRNIQWTKKVRYFEYMWKDTPRKYFPDFFLSEYDVYVEVKGYETDRDTAKWASVPNLLIVRDKHIKLIKENNFDLSQVS